MLAYGSLMHPAELAKHCAQTESVPVRVRGFRRSFSQEPSWRAGDGIERGVLTARRSERDWFNGILIRGSDAAALRSIEKRERGYTRVNVPAPDITLYAMHEIDELDEGSHVDEVDEPEGNWELNEIDEIGLYTGRDDKRNDELLPNPVYLDLCIEAARQWGCEFASDFLRTTYVGARTLDDLAGS